MEQQVPAYEVISTQDSQMRNPNGLSVPSKMVHVRFADGTISHVEVVHAPQWSEEAKAAIESLYEEHQNIMQTKGPMVTVQQRRPGLNNAPR